MGVYYDWALLSYFLFCYSLVFVTFSSSLNKWNRSEAKMGGFDKHVFLFFFKKQIPSLSMT